MKWSGSAPFAGALVLHGMTAGIYVTTSRFRRGARATVKALAVRGYRTELTDADHFYAALKLVQRKAYESFAEFPRGRTRSFAKAAKQHSVWIRPLAVMK